MSPSPPADGVYPVVVVGAGAAGVGAGRTLARAGLDFAVLEGRDRAGGRAHSLVGRSGAGIDLGCGWLHSADQNPWVAIADAEGFAIDRTRPPWENRLEGVNLSRAEMKRFSKAFDRFEARLAEASQDGGPDRPASVLYDEETAPWRPMLDAFSGAYNGCPFSDISIHDYAAYQPTEENWRLPRGYGALVAAAAEPLPIRFGTAVTRIDHTGPILRLGTAGGEVMAERVIVAVPTTVLAEERLAFDPPLPDLLHAAAALPLGHVNKCFLALEDADAFPVETMVSGRTDTADTGSYSLRPLGRAMIEGFFGGEAAGVLEREGPGALTAFATDELCALFGTDLRRRLRPLAESRWSSDPFSRGAYSHARPGHAGARAVLRAPVEDRIFFAGEACSPHAFSTAHGALQTGEAAAAAVLESLSPSRA